MNFDRKEKANRQENDGGRKEKQMRIREEEVMEGA